MDKYQLLIFIVLDSIHHVAVSCITGTILPTYLPLKDNTLSQPCREPNLLPGRHKGCEP